MSVNKQEKKFSRLEDEGNDGRRGISESAGGVGMFRPEIVLCANDQPIILDLESIAGKCPPILTRFLGMDKGATSTDMAGLCFKESARDEQGRLTFAKHLDISRSGFQACITFLKTGYVGCTEPASVELLLCTMDILGGSEKLDAYVAKCQVEKVEKEARNELKMRNPMTPEEDIFDLYQWNSGPIHYGQEGWSITGTKLHGSLHKYYWRRLK